MKYKIVVKYARSTKSEFQIDRKDLNTIQSILALYKCVIIGTALYTFDNIVSIERV